MKKLLLFVLSLSVFTLTEVFAQSAVVTVSKFEGKPIRGVIIAGAFDVQLSQGGSTGAQVQVREDLVSELTFELTSDNYVRIGFGNDMTKYFTGKNSKPLAKIVVSELAYLDVSGACSVIAKGEFTSASVFQLKMAGTAFVSWIKMSKAPGVSIDLSGKCKVEDTAIDVASGDVSLKVNGSASAMINVSCGMLTADIQGFSLVELSGSATRSYLRVNDGSSVNMLRMKCMDIETDVLGLSKVQADVPGKAKVVVGKTASFRYVGDGTVTGVGARRM